MAELWQGACAFYNQETFTQEIDGFALKPVLVQDTGYMVEKTYQLARYLGTFGAYLMPQGPI